MSNQQQDQGPDSRVVCQGLLRIKGSLHPKLPRMLLSQALYSALVAVRSGDQGVTVFWLQLGPAVEIELTGDMAISPTLKQHTSTHCGDGGVIQLSIGSKYVQLNMANQEEDYQYWFRALREALAETAFREAFAASRAADGSLSADAIDKAIQLSVAFVHPANCHVLRAKRVLETQSHIHKFSKRIKVKPYVVAKEEAEEFLEETDSDPLFLNDPEVMFIRALLPRLFTRAEIERNSHRSCSRSSSSVVEESHKILQTPPRQVPPSLLQSTECRENDSQQLPRQLQPQQRQPQQPSPQRVGKRNLPAAVHVPTPVAADSSGGDENRLISNEFAKKQNSLETNTENRTTSSNAVSPRSPLRELNGPHTGRPTNGSGGNGNGSGSGSGAVGITLKKEVAIINHRTPDKENNRCSNSIADSSYSNNSHSNSNSNSATVCEYASAPAMVVAISPLSREKSSGRGRGGGGAAKSHTRAASIACKMLSPCEKEARGGSSSGSSSGSNTVVVVSDPWGSAARPELLILRAAVTSPMPRRHRHSPQLLWSSPAGAECHTPRSEAQCEQGSESMDSDYAISYIHRDPTIPGFTAASCLRSLKLFYVIILLPLLLAGVFIRADEVVQQMKLSAHGVCPVQRTSDSWLAGAFCSMLSPHGRSAVNSSANSAVVKSLPSFNHGTAENKLLSLSAAERGGGNTPQPNFSDKDGMVTITSPSADLISVGAAIAVSSSGVSGEESKLTTEYVVVRPHSIRVRSSKEERIKRRNEFLDMVLFDTLE
jgi:hypothetical protein